MLLLNYKFIFLLLNPPQIGSIVFHCKCFIITLVFAFINENKCHKCCLLNLTLLNLELFIKSHYLNATLCTIYYRRLNSWGIESELNWESFCPGEDRPKNKNHTIKPFISSCPAFCSSEKFFTEGVLVTLSFTRSGRNDNAKSTSWKNRGPKDGSLRNTTVHNLSLSSTTVPCSLICLMWSLT